MLKEKLKEFYADCDYQNKLLDNETRIKKYLDFASKFRELKTLKDNLNNNRVSSSKSNIEKVTELSKDIIDLSKYFRVEFDTKSIIEQSRIKKTDIDEVLSNKGFTMKKIGNHEITKQVYKRYQEYKKIVTEHLEKGGQLYDYAIKVSCGRGNSERLEESIKELNAEGFGIISEVNNEAHSNYHSHEVLLVTNSLHAGKILGKFFDLGASKNSIDVKTAFLLPNPNNILVEEEVKKQEMNNFDPEKMSKSMHCAANKNILAYRKENYMNPTRQLGGITAKGLSFKVQGKVISENNTYIVKNPLTWVNQPSQLNEKKTRINKVK
jgi:hypothetical protein